MPPTREYKWINSNVVFIDQEMSIKDAVDTMVSAEISSVLVINKDEEIVGIITERDIVRKFTLLDMADKLTRNALTIMSRPVSFVTLQDLNHQIIKLHLKKRLRHFPVLLQHPAVKNNVIGMVSITDFLKQYIEPGKVEAPESNQIKVPLGIMAQGQNSEAYQKLFGQLGFQTFPIVDFHLFYRKLGASLPHVLFDWDGYTPEVLKDLILAVRKYQGHSIFVTSNPQLVAAFRPHLSSERQSIAMKPIDISYCSWLMTHKWEVKP